MLTKQTRTRANLTGFVTVRLRKDGLDPPKAEPLEQHAKRKGFEGIAAVLEKLGNPKSERLIRAVPMEKVLEMERRAAQTEFPPLHSLAQYWRIDLRHLDRGEMERAVMQIRQAREVDMVQEDVQPMPAAVTPGDDDYNAGQGYQDAAPTGIDARWMWTQADGEGAGVAVVDIEGGWLVTHEDLTGKAPTLIHGAQSTNPDWVNHGTAVLGEIAATDNAVGVVGTAPAITSVRMSSIFDAAQNFHVEDAFIAAIAAMNAGEILLIELQTSFEPMETLDALLDLIRLAVAQGILVVEAAGNGAEDLDAWTTPGGLLRLNRTSADFVDSGALMVGACVSAVPHERWWASNFGTRIDCFAWGENVTTCGYGDLDDGGGDTNKEYTDTFQGTSSASPIIVSAAALVQARHKAVAGTFLSPTQMRTVLSNPTTGTVQGVTVAGAIGVMPDLAAVLPALGLVPDIYLRDAVGDTGVVPWMGSISTSPDVIVRPDSVADPQMSYGQGSGTEGSDTLGYEVESGQDNFIYVRVRNRGGSAAANVVATVYWSEVATLVTPGMWHLVGSTTIPNVPTGDLLTVSDEIVWPKGQIPATGHYCFVATLHHADDPAPPTPGTMSFSDFYDLIKAQNNVTWRNFNVVNVLPDPPSATTAFEFLLTGAEGEPEPFEFVVERNVPWDAKLVLEGPLQLIRLKLGRVSRDVKIDRRKKTAEMVLPSLPRIALGKARLGKGDRFPCRLSLIPGKTRITWGHGVAVRQLYRGEEVGRVAWQFAPEVRLGSKKERSEKEHKEQYSHR